MKAWQMKQLGDPWDGLTLDDVRLPEVTPGLCRVKVDATDLNFADILQCQGAYQVKAEPPFTPGMSLVGTVVEENETRYEPGDRIVGQPLLGSGGFAEEALMLASQVTRVPGGVDPVMSAAMHVTYGTAWFGLHLRGNLRPEETVLVLAAAGGVGSAAVDLAKVHGCWVIAAAGGKEKTDACLKLGADEVVDYSSEDLYQRVMELTDGRGVDVVYDPVGGEYFDVARRLVAWEGKYLVIGFAAGSIPSAPMNHALVKNYSLVGVHMGGYRGRDDKPFERCYDELYDQLLNGKLSPLIDRVVGFSELPDALHALANRQTIGRLVFTPT